MSLKLQNPDATAAAATLPLSLSFCRSLEGVSIDELVHRFGSPLFVYSEGVVRETIRRLRRAFESRYPRVEIAWSYKTNYLNAICSMMHQEGAIAEIVSRMEYQKAKALGVAGKRIVFNGPHKPMDLLNEAVHDGVVINMDHLDELRDLEQIAEQSGRKLDVGLRVNLDCGVQPAWTRFGFNLESGQATEAVERIYSRGLLSLTGLHCHIGTSVRDVEAYRRAALNLVAFAYEMRDRFGASIDSLDIGGGFASSARLRTESPSSDREEPSFDEYAEAICGALHSVLEPGHRPRLILESGRALIDDAASLVTSIIALKHLPDGTPAYVADAGVNLLTTSSHYRFDLALADVASNEVEASAATESVIYGPMCMNSDEVARASLPPLKRGQRMIVSPVGAYNNTQWWQFIEYRPNIVIVCEDGSVELLREAEDLSDIERRERLPAKFVFLP